VLLGDADVDEPVGEPLAEGEQAARVRHRRGEGDDLGPGLGLGDEGLGERRRARPGLHRAGVVHVLDQVVLGGRVAPALLGEDVDDDRPVVLGGVAEGGLDALDVVAVEGAGVADAQVLEERRRLEVVADAGHRGLEAALEPVADDRRGPQQLLEARPVAHVARVEAQAGEALAQAADRGGVGAAVVVQDDDGP
jgi:hypothetical protein